MSVGRMSVVCRQHWLRVARKEPKAAARVIVEGDATLARLAGLVGFDQP